MWAMFMMTVLLGKVREFYLNQSGVGQNLIPLISIIYTLSFDHFSFLSPSPDFNGPCIVISESISGVSLFEK